MKVIKVLPYLILLLTIPTIAQWLNLNTQNLTTVWWILNGIIILMFLKGRKYYFPSKSLPFFIKVFLGLVILEIIYGFYRAEGYWDYKFLINSAFTFLTPLSILVFSNPKILKSVLNRWFSFALISFFFFLPFMQLEAPGKYLIPIMFMLLIFKPLPLRSKMIVLLFFTFIFVFGSLGSRASVIKYTIALFFGLSTYTKLIYKKSLLKFLHFTLMVIPFVFLYLGLIGVFNVFNFDEYISTKQDLEVQNAYSEGETENLTSDTRTFLYVETISSAFNNDYFLIGNSLARGYESPWFGHLDHYGRGERYSTEVSILNIFTHFGLLGVIVYFGIFYTASYSAINKSKSGYLKMFGLFICFRWVFAWVEDFSRFDLNYLFLWIIIGLCYSKPFLKMNNIEFELWAKGLLFKRKKSKNFRSERMKWN